MRDFKETSEKQVEQYIVRQIKKLGGTAYKFTSPGRRSVPDRICVMPKGTIVFVEVKKKSGSLTPGQRHEISAMRKLGHIVAVAYGMADARAFIQLVQDLLQCSEVKGV